MQDFFHRTWELRKISTWTLPRIRGFVIGRPTIPWLSSFLPLESCLLVGAKSQEFLGKLTVGKFREKSFVSGLKSSLPWGWLEASANQTSARVLKLQSRKWLEILWSTSQWCMWAKSLGFHGFMGQSQCHKAPSLEGHITAASIGSWCSWRQTRSHSEHEKKTTGFSCRFSPEPIILCFFSGAARLLHEAGAVAQPQKVIYKWSSSSMFSMSETVGHYQREVGVTVFHPSFFWGTIVLEPS